MHENRESSLSREDGFMRQPLHCKCSCTEMVQLREEQRYEEGQLLRKEGLTARLSGMGPALAVRRAI